jgi:hypothetical protein
MQRLCLEVFRQMLGLFKKHFGSAHVCNYDGPQFNLNQARMRLSEKREAQYQAPGEISRGDAENAEKQNPKNC